MRQVPILLFVMAVFLLPAAAQGHFHRQELPARISDLQTLVVHGQPSSGTASGILPDPRLELTTPRYVHATAGPLPGAVRISQTPFEQRFSMPLAGLWHGHMQVKGFASFDSMENVLWGPPASGNLPARSVTTQSHVGVWAPEQNQSYGLTLTLHRKASDASSHSLHPEHWIGRVFRHGRT